MNSLDWLFDRFGWVFEMTPSNWVYLIFAIVVARITIRLLWFLLFPASFKAHKKKRDLAKKQAKNDLDAASS